MFVVGLTGGIGSGKTAASDKFKSLGIDVIDADVASRTVVERGKPALNTIAEHFGPNILLPDQTLDRAELRKRIFSDPKEKQWLENLLHPLINQEILDGISSARSPYAIFVSPLLIESKQRQHCDRILVIDVPEQLQIDRTIKRDNNDAQQVKRIVASQASREQRLEEADDVIENAGSLEALLRQVDTLHQDYLTLADGKDNQ